MRAKMIYRDFAIKSHLLSPMRRVHLINELTATLTATQSTISPSTKIITQDSKPDRTTVHHHGPFGWIYGLEVSASASGR